MNPLNHSSETVVSQVAAGAPDGAVQPSTTSPQTLTLPPIPAVDQTAATMHFEGNPAATLTNSVAFPSPSAASVELPPGYEYLDRLGRGGMGIVYKAMQIKASRIVALKMILSGVDAGEAERERFRVEAESIARLQHPFIVQVFEINEWQRASQDAPAPYFALEYCEGGSLDKKLSGKPIVAREAAELVRQLAQAMAHAHARDVIHRDLKPANVLLKTIDETATALIPEDAVSRHGSLRNPTQGVTLKGYLPKITDFGLARRLDSELRHTMSGAIMGTPHYMAPEQARGEKTVGPPADLYALGAILYECLTGRPPFLGASPIQTIAQVCNLEPVPPRQLQPDVPKDLETICLKCLQKDPAKRYADADALQADLGRYLEGKAIRARPVGPLERAVKWVNRNPAVAGLLAGIGAVILVGFILVAWQWQRAVDRERAEHVARRDAEVARSEAEAAREREATIATANADLAIRESRARIQAESAEAQAKTESERARLAEKKALGESTRAQQSLSFLSELFRVSDPLEFAGYSLRSSQERGSKLTAQDLLDRGAKEIGRKLKDQPEARASLLNTIGDVYRSMGRFDQAAAMLEESLELRRRQYGDDHPETAVGLAALGWLHLDRGDFDEAESLFRRALRIQEAKLPPDDPATFDSRFQVAWVLAMYGDPAAEPLFKSVIDYRLARLGPNHRETIIAQGGLAAFLIDQHRYLEALPLINAMLRFARSQEGGKNIFEAVSLFQQGTVSAAMGLQTKAQQSFEKSLELARAQLGDDHYYIGLLRHELAVSLFEQGKMQEADREFKECLRIARTTVGMAHPRATIGLRNYSAFLVKMNRPKEAIALFDEAVRASEKRFGAKNRWRFWLLADLSRLEAKHGDRNRAEKLALEASALVSITPRSDHEKALMLNAVASDLPSPAQDPTAEKLYRQAIALRQPLEAKHLDDLADLLWNYGLLIARQGRCTEAEELYLEAEKKGQNTPTLRGDLGVAFYRDFAGCLMQMGKFAEAEERYRKMLELMRKLPNYPARIDRLCDMVGCLVLQGKREAAATMLPEATQQKVNNQTLFYEGPLRQLCCIQTALGQTANARQNMDLLKGVFGKDRRRWVLLNLARTNALLGTQTTQEAEDSLWPCVAELTELPSDRSACTLALVLLRGNETEEAERILLANRPAQGEPSVMAEFLRAWCEMQRGNASAAKKIHDAARLRFDAELPTVERPAKAAVDWFLRLEITLLRDELANKIGKTPR